MVPNPAPDCRRIAPLLLLPLLLPGCIQIEQTVLLNPDNSGKATIRATLTSSVAGLMQGLAQDDGKETAEALSKQLGTGMAKAFAASMIHESTGIDAWDQVKYGPTKEGGFTFEGVAYFPDLNKLSTTSTANADGTPSMPQLFNAERTSNGSWVVRGLPDQETGKAPPTPGKALPPDELEAKLKELRQNWETMEAIATPMLKDAKTILNLQVAGTIRECTGWRQTSPQSASLEIDMAAILAHLGAIMKDDAALREALTAGRVTEDGFPQPDFTELRKFLFHGADKADLVITPGPPLFDYAAESAKAKAGMADLLKELPAK